MICANPLGVSHNVLLLSEIVPFVASLTGRGGRLAEMGNQTMLARSRLVLGSSESPHSSWFEVLEG